MNNEGYQITYTGEEVQELLDKAGTAVQTETDPTVPSWAKAEEKPTYTATEVGALPEDTELFSGSYDDLTDKPTIPDSLSELSDDSTHRLVTDAEKTAWNGKSDFSGSYNDLTDKPTIPDSLSDLSDDSTHRVVTDTEKSTWSAKSDFSGSYNDLTDKPTIPDAQVQSDWTEADSTKVDYIKNKPSLATVATSGSYADLSNKPSIPSAQIQSDWSQSDNTALDYIKNKPSIPAAGLPTGGNAGQVLCKTDGSTDYAVGWTNQTTNYPSAYCTTSGSTAAKKASCTLYAAQANSYLHVLIGSNNISASALTLNVNSEGAKPIYINGTASSATNYTLPKGTYIVFYDGTNYYFRTDGKIQAPNGTLVSTSSTSGLIKNDGTIDTTTYISDVSGKADKVTSATNGNFAALDSNGNLTDSGHKHSDYLTSHQDLSNYVQKSNTTGLLKNDGSVDTNTYLTSAPVTSVNGQAGAVSLTLGDANVIETVKVNGSALTPDANKAVDITVPSVSGKEDTTNKVTSLSSSSTDTQYPSAKCVYDLIGDIETLLAAI